MGEDERAIGDLYTSGHVVTAKPVQYATRQLRRPGRWHGVTYPPGSWVLYSLAGECVGVVDEVTFRRLYTLDPDLEVVSWG